MERLLDFSTPLDINLLDNVVQTFYTGSGTELQMAQQILTQFQENPDAWQRVTTIMEQSNNPPTKYFALQILEKLIQTRWKILPEEERLGIRYYIVNVVIQISADETKLHSQRTYVNKLNMVLVQILKQEWPQNWPNFIPEIVESSKTNITLCENNMAILKLLSEEIFDYSAEQMTQAKAKNLKDQMCGEFSEIYQLCTAVLEKAQKPSLINATLETLLRFLNWIPLGYIFETPLIEKLTERFLTVPAFRNVTLKCLNEIAGLSVGTDYNERFVVLFKSTFASVTTVIPPDTDIASIYQNSSDEEQEFVQNLAIFLTSYLSLHLPLIENLPNRDALLIAHTYLVKISAVDEREVFKICLEYWTRLVSQLYEEVQNIPDTQLLGLSGISGVIPSVMLAQAPLRKHLYAEVLSSLRLVMIERMVKPEEVLIVENDDGEIVREFVKETDTITLYKSMREVLVYLTHLDVVDTENIMAEKLSKQMDGTEWSWSNLNKLCWAIGSISGAMAEEIEKHFLVTVIKDLLALTEMKRGKDNKAVVASNIMYIVGQYPRFLKAHWKFLKTVVNKNFEFMHESHEGVQDMACDTFMKIAQKCRRHFILQQSGEVMPFIDEILNSLPQITSDLTHQQVHTVYESIGYMIGSQTNKQIQERLITKLMEMPNTAWDGIIAQAARQSDILNSQDTVKMLINILKTNVSACTSIGSGFQIQLGRIYMDMLGLYKATSELVSAAVANDAIAPKTPRVRQLRAVKKEILKLIDTYVLKADDPNAKTQIHQTLLPPLFEAVLADYARGHEVSREADVLNLMDTIITKLGDLVTENIKPILDSVLECTLQMITRDFIEYPEHRSAFFKLIRAINRSCFTSLLHIPPQQFRLIMDSIAWALKHTMRDIADTGLHICLELLDNVVQSEQSISNSFFQTYYLRILQDVFYVLTDSDHKSNFKMQTVVLARLFRLIELNEIHTLLFDPAQVPNPKMTNAEFLRAYLTNLLQNAFSHLNAQQISVFVEGLFLYYQDINSFKPHVRDFLIQLREFAGNSADLFLEEREKEIELHKKMERERALAVPGLLKPAEIDNDDDMA